MKVIKLGSKSFLVGADKSFSVMQVVLHVKGIYIRDFTYLLFYVFVSALQELSRQKLYHFKISENIFIRILTRRSLILLQINEIRIVRGQLH